MPDKMVNAPGRLRSNLQMFTTQKGKGAVHCSCCFLQGEPHPIQLTVGSVFFIISCDLESGHHILGNKVEADLGRHA